jgi:hypothetical protein
MGGFQPNSLFTVKDVDMIIPHELHGELYHMVSSFRAYFSTKRRNCLIRSFILFI